MRISSKWGLALAVASLSTGCYGSFALTKKVHTWNGEVCGTQKGPGCSAGWGNEGVFLLCAIPVYGICIVVDSVVLNTVEFWSGTNPVGMVATSELDDIHDLRLEKVADGQVKVEILEAGDVVGTYRVDQGVGSSVLRDVSGVAIATAVTDANGAVSMVAAQ